MKLCKYPLFALSAVIFASAAMFAQDTGTFVFYRTDNSYKPSIFCDGVELGRLQGKHYFEAEAAVGQHTCTVEKSDNQKEAVTLNVTPGSKTFLKVHYGFKYHLRVVTPEEGRADTAGLALADREWVYKNKLAQNSRLNTAPSAESFRTKGNSTPSSAFLDYRVVYDKPSAWTYYHPKKSINIGTLSRWEIDPYVGQQGETTTLFLRMSYEVALVTNLNLDVRGVQFNVDGRLWNVPMEQMRNGSSYGGKVTYYFHGEKLYDIFQAVSNGKDVYILVHQYDPKDRLTVHLKPEHFESFGLVAKKYLELSTVPTQ